MKTVELRRHTASDGDRLTDEGIAAAVEIGGLLADHYDLLISSGAQRATQTLACFLAGGGKRFPAGVNVDLAFRSQVEDRWFAAARQSGGGGLESFLEVDRALVDEEADRFGSALRRVFDALPEGGRALIVGHSPMHEVAIYGVTGTIVPPISKGAGVLLVQDDGDIRVAAGPSISLEATFHRPRRARNAARTSSIVIKLVYCITRRPGMPLEEFSRYWHDVHGPIGRRIPGLRRLVQSHPIPHPDDIAPQAFDGMAELWFDDLPALRAAQQSAEWRASSEDEANFIDHSRTALFVTVEREIPS